MQKSILLFVLLMISASGPAPASRTLCQGFLPENNLHIPVAISAMDFMPRNNLRIPQNSTNQGIGEAGFQAVLDRLDEIYSPIITARGGQFVISRLWTNARVNATAERDGNKYTITMYGGLARHDTVTLDGFALVACHEIGHLVGGAPRRVLSNEGQADYFANLKCLRRLYAADDSGFFAQTSMDPVVAMACAASHKSGTDQALCNRVAMAGDSIANLFAALGQLPKSPAFDTPDPSIVQSTYDGHPAAQCRLDTYFQGSLCTKKIGDAVSDTDVAPGTCVRSAGTTTGTRPLCWYRPTPSAAWPNNLMAAAPNTTPALAQAQEKINAFNLAINSRQF